MNADIYQKLRNELKQLLDNENQNLSWDILESFSKELIKASQDDFKLYRYSPADYYNIRNFEMGQLRLTCNGVLNDIHEGLPVYDITDEERDKLQVLKDCAYIKCFSEKFNSNTMWAHYGDSHKGICVEYDLSLLDWKDEKLLHIFPVLYGNERPFAGSMVLDICDSQKWLNHDIFQNAYPSEMSILNDALLLFLFKGTEWDREREWRILYSKYQLYNRSDSGLIDKAIEFDIATAIYLGQRMDQDIKKNISEIVDRINCRRQTTHKKQIRIYSMEPDKMTYELCKRALGRNEE